MISSAIIKESYSKAGLNGSSSSGKIYSSLSRSWCSGLNCSNMNSTSFGIVVGVSIAISILFLSGIFILKCYLKSRNKTIDDV